jgi:hypothetical protein
VGDILAPVSDPACRERAARIRGAACHFECGVRTAPCRRYAAPPARPVPPAPVERRGTEPAHRRMRPPAAQPAQARSRARALTANIDRPARFSRITGTYPSPRRAASRQEWHGTRRLSIANRSIGQVGRGPARLRRR